MHSKKVLKMRLHLALIALAHCSNVIGLSLGFSPGFVRVNMRIFTDGHSL